MNSKVGVGKSTLFCNVAILLLILLSPVTSFAQDFNYLLKSTPGLVVKQWFNYLPTSKTGQVVMHDYYSLSYSEKWEQAEWVAYELTKKETSGSNKRTGDFREDRQVSTGSARLADYKGSGYVRGHLAPAGDMKFSSTAMSESFYLSNISPQKPEFNRGIWKKLESQVRTWAYRNVRIYVVTGGVLNSCDATIGSNEVGVPQYYYKVILDYKQPDIKAIALVLPNRKGTQPLSSYVESIDYVEDLTGIDFFPDLPDELENRLESNSDANKWTWKSAIGQCNGVTAKGNRCKRKVKHTPWYCSQHEEQRN